MAWTIAADGITLPRQAEELADVRPLLNRLVAAFGPRALARLLDVRPGSVANWARGRRQISHEMARRIIDVHDVLTRALQIFQADTAMRWLVGNEPFLGNQRPVDVLAIWGAAPIIEALNNIDVGAYA